MIGTLVGNDGGSSLCVHAQEGSTRRSARWVAVMFDIAILCDRPGRVSVARCVTTACEAVLEFVKFAQLLSRER